MVSQIILIFGLCLFCLFYFALVNDKSSNDNLMCIRAAQFRTTAVSHGKSCRLLRLISCKLIRVHISYLNYSKNQSVVLMKRKISAVCI